MDTIAPCIYLDMPCQHICHSGYEKDRDSLLEDMCICDAMMANLDDNIGWLMDALHRMGLSEDTFAHAFCKVRGYAQADAGAQD